LNFQYFAIEANDMIPVIDCSFLLGEIDADFGPQYARRHCGKIVLDI
jgi:hypothetical protein